ncbi:MAG TPA: response regulator transcription factor [Thermoanaerobaculia bacterium]|nr:response regulator transcription factor [Thermoanaerobaculia bacterium]
MHRPIKLLVVDRHQLFRECLASVLAAPGSGMQVELAEGAEPALARLQDGPADVLLAGFDLPGGGARALVHRVAACHPEVRIVLLGSSGTEEAIVDCLEAGARGYVLREQSLDELKLAIERVARGRVVVTPEIAYLLFARLGELGGEHRLRRRLEFLDLTARELEILKLLARELTNQEIADQLYLSVHTVKNHVHNLLERLQLKTRAEAVQHARERGWLRLSPPR